MDKPRQHTRHGLTAEYRNADIYLSARMPCETPLSLATEKSAQLYALLFLACDNAEAGVFGDLNAEIQNRVLTLAAGLAHEAMVLSELAAQCEAEAPAA
ncbi:hypothetical protein P3W85_25585 [Cupriavidus basilensis]|uniref:DUF3077 domain-containing protein n=2 Tax=Cupriavidus basilensis TaxID=68895 RepID=A0ABT6AUK7_9BURK|nr:hypothetical protein [Cupriavidus basilensis]MDF3836295.1 hypothetical protein [Cupriavidus basilensis]